MAHVPRRCQSLARVLVLIGFVGATAQTIGAQDVNGFDAGARDALRWNQGRHAADWISTGLTATALILPCLRDRTWRCVGNEGLQIWLGVMSAELFKRLTQRPRPNGHDTLSWWSEHTMLACLATIPVGVRTDANLPRLSWTLCPAVGYLRIAADQHWASDVLTGAGVGAGIAARVGWGR